MSNQNKLFSWQNINSFVRGIIEPHTQAVNMRLNEYIDFNDQRHEEFKNDINKRFNEFKAWTEKELANLRTWTQAEIKYLKDTLLDEETGKLKYDVIPVNQLVEVGTIMAWPVATAMVDKYLYCDGSKIPDGSQYYQLKNVLGSDYLPDYRGVFLRGYGSCTSSHYGTVTHTSGALGALQGDSIRNIAGRFDSQVPHRDCTGPFYTQHRGQTDGNGDDGYTSNPWVYFDASRCVPTAIENRPINKAIKYFIRAIG